MPQDKVSCSAEPLAARFRELLPSVWPKGIPARVLVAVSGGADSTALAHLCHALLSKPSQTGVPDCAGTGISHSAGTRIPSRSSSPPMAREGIHAPAQSMAPSNPLTAREGIHAPARSMTLEFMAIAHFHHHLRPVEADEEEAFVRALAERLEVPYRRGDWTRQGREDLPHSDRNLQAAARRARYEFLLKTAKEMDIPAVVTAHHRDDQVETIFFNLSRGGGTGAWQGIRPAIQRQGVWILRPLLAFSREDLLAYLGRLGESHREDSSNLSRKYSRNRIRHELLPEAVSQDPGLLEDLLARNACAQSEEANWLEVLESVKAESLRLGDVWTLPRKRFDLMPEEGCFYCLRQLLWEISGAGEGWYPVRRKSLTALLGLLKSGGEGEVTLPGRVRVRLRGATLVLQKVK